MPGAWRRLACVVATLLAASPCRADAPPLALTAEEQALFEWWDGLGYPDVAHLEIGRRVRDGSPGGEGTRVAFLLARDLESDTVFQVDLEVVRVRHLDGERFERTDVVATLVRALALRDAV